VVLVSPDGVGEAELGAAQAGGDWRARLAAVLRVCAAERAGSRWRSVELRRHRKCREPRQKFKGRLYGRAELELLRRMIPRS
jgi:hypothetical protein